MKNWWSWLNWRKWSLNRKARAVSPNYEVVHEVRIMDIVGRVCKYTCEDGEFHAVRIVQVLTYEDGTSEETTLFQPVQLIFVHQVVKQIDEFLFPTKGPSE